MAQFQKGNKFALGNNGGKPPFYETPKQLEDKCFEYFEYCITNKEKVNVTGLALYLGFSERKSLCDYEKKPEFIHVIKRAKLTVEHSYENSGSTFDMFALKNMGWKDKTEVDANVNNTGSINVTDWIKNRTSND